MKSSKSKGKDNARTRKGLNQHPAEGPGLSGALVALLGRWGRRTGGSEGLLEALHAGNK